MAHLKLSRGNSRTCRYDRLEERRLLAIDFGDAPDGVPIAVADLNPGLADSAPSSLSIVFGDLYFTAWDPSGRRSFRLDAETNQLTRLTGLRDASGYREFQGQVAFHAGTNPSVVDSRGLFLLDPDSERVTELIPGPADAGTFGFTEFQGKLYMRTPGPDGNELYRFDPADGVFEQFADISPGLRSSNPRIEVINETMLVRAEGPSGFELYRLDTASDSLVLYDINPGPSGSFPTDFTVYDGDIYFGANGPTGDELYRLNASDQTVELAVEIDPSLSNVFGPTELAVFDEMLYFTANSGAGDELHRYDSATDTLEQVADINSGSADAFPKRPVQIGDRLYFNARGEDGFELFVLDLSTDQVSQVADLLPGPGNSTPRSMTIFEGKLYFVADAGNGAELHVLDPETLDVSMARDPRLSAPVVSVSSLTVFNNQLLFRGNGSRGFELHELARYATKQVNAGASHEVVMDAPRLGNIIDVELEGQPDESATGDDLDSNESDEDGVFFPTHLIAGDSSNIAITVSDPNGVGSFVDAWIDFNRDGDWDDAGEQILLSQTVVDGFQVFNVDIPGNARLGETYARVRLSTSGGLTPTGPAGDGEVEDYLIDINARPVAFDDRVFTSENEPVAVNVLLRNGNQIDFDPEEDPLLVSSVTPALNGTAQIIDEQTVLYTPATGFVGEDSFAYALDDGQGGFAFATVIVQVDPKGTIVLDNSEDGVATEGGGWRLGASVAGFVGENYQVAEGGDRSTRFSIPRTVSGLYQVSVNWTAHPNRSADARVEIAHRDGIETITVDQTLDAGGFQPLGNYSFLAGQTHSVTVKTLGTDGVIVADAVRLVPVESATIEVDNSHPEFSIERGSWRTSQAVPGYVGENYRHAAPGSDSIARFTPEVLQSGAYEVFAHWTSHPNRASNALFEVFHKDGFDFITVDQTQGGGEFQSLGVFEFVSGQSHFVAIRSDDANGYVIADAIRLVPSVAASRVIDNSDPGFTIEGGTWGTSTSVSGFIGANYRVAAAGANTARFTPRLPVGGRYEVLANWTNRPNRARNATFEVIHQDGVTEVRVDQSRNGASFQSLGIFSFNSGVSGSVVVRASGADGFVIADAIQWQLVPDETSANSFASSAQSPATLLDVNRDTRVTPNDALTVINYLGNRSAVAKAVREVTVEEEARYDVNADGRISPIDALRIVNVIASSNAREGEQVFGSSLRPEFKQWMSSIDKAFEEDEIGDSLF
ncbi:MAG: GEVED domain-containing protein [Planctomycetota bacterium]